MKQNSKSLAEMRGVTDAKLKETLESDGVYIMGKVVPPRDCNSYDQSVWVSMEVRHTVGNLKNMPNADMITLQVPPEDLRPMIDPSFYDTTTTGGGAASNNLNRYKSKKRKSTASATPEEEKNQDDIVISQFIYSHRH